MANLYLGIDPGAQGAIAVLRGRALAIHKMPETPHELAALLREQLDAGECFAMVEKIVGAARSLDKKSGFQSSWKFGFNVGSLYGVLAAAQMPHELVMPARWQKLMACRTGGDKHISHAQALRLYPSAKIPIYAADAVLLADLCMRMKRGERMPGEFTQQSAAAGAAT